MGQGSGFNIRRGSNGEGRGLSPPREGHGWEEQEQDVRSKRLRRNKGTDSDCLGVVDRSLLQVGRQDQGRGEQVELREVRRMQDLPGPLRRVHPDPRSEGQLAAIQGCYGHSEGWRLKVDGDGTVSKLESGLNLGRLFVDIQGRVSLGRWRLKGLQKGLPGVLF